MADVSTDIRETVRERYAAAATGGSCCGVTDEAGTQVFGDALYAPAEVEGATGEAVAASLGCGVPTAVAGPESSHWRRANRGWHEGRALHLL